MSASLSLTDLQTGQCFESTQSRTTLGRGIMCDIILTSPMVGKQPAAINRVDDLYFLEDLRSRNGIFLNDTRVNTSVPLQSGDQIRISDITLLVQITSGVV